MSKETETTQAVEFAFGKMEQYFDAAKTVIEQYGGDVADLALMALRVEAISEFLPVVMLVPLGIVFYKIGKSVWQTADEDFDRFMIGNILYVVGGVFALFALTTLLNIWAWAGIFYPELYAVHKFILN